MAGYYWLALTLFSLEHETSCTSLCAGADSASRHRIHLCARNSRTQRMASPRSSSVLTYRSTYWCRRSRSSDRQSWRYGIRSFKSSDRPKEAGLSVTSSQDPREPKAGQRFTEQFCPTFAYEQAIIKQWSGINEKITY